MSGEGFDWKDRKYFIHKMNDSCMHDLV